MEPPPANNLLAQGFVNTEGEKEKEKDEMLMNKQSRSVVIILNSQARESIKTIRTKSKRAFYFRTARLPNQINMDYDPINYYILLSQHFDKSYN